MIKDFFIRSYYRLQTKMFRISQYFIFTQRNVFIIIHSERD